MGCKYIVVVILIILLLCLKAVKMEPCEQDFNDKTVNDDIKAILQESVKEGKGKFISNCPLLVPNTTVSTNNAHVFKMSISRNACISKSHRKGKAPNTYIELDKEGTNDTVLNIGGAFSPWYWIQFSRTGFFLPYSTVYVNIQNYTLMEINEKKNIVTLELALSMMWMDLGLFSYPSTDVTAYNLTAPEEGYEISDEAAKMLWKPELPIHHLAYYKAFIDSINTVSLRIKRTNHRDGNVCVSGPMIIHEIEVQISFYCKLDLSNYPLDTSHCELRLGGKTSDVAFKLVHDGQMRHNSTDIEILDVIATFSEVENDCGKQTKRCIGLDIVTKRVLRPYLLKYYIPCTTIVIMSQISFIIPLEALPGRVALVVTQFLTLTSLFIQQMVSNCFYSLFLLIQQK